MPKYIDQNHFYNSRMPLHSCCEMRVMQCMTYFFCDKILIFYFIQQHLLITVQILKHLSCIFLLVTLWVAYHLSLSCSPAELCVIRQITLIFFAGWIFLLPGWIIFFHILFGKLYCLAVCSSLFIWGSRQAYSCRTRMH